MPESTPPPSHKTPPTPPIETSISKEVSTQEKKAKKVGVNSLTSQERGTAASKVPEKTENITAQEKEAVDHFAAEIKNASEKLEKSLSPQPKNQEPPPPQAAVVNTIVGMIEPKKKLSFTEVKGKILEVFTTMESASPDLQSLGVPKKIADGIATLFHNLKDTFYTDEEGVGFPAALALLREEVPKIFADQDKSVLQKIDEFLQTVGESFQKLTHFFIGLEATDREGALLSVRMRNRLIGALSTLITVALLAFFIVKAVGFIAYTVTTLIPAAIAAAITPHLVNLAKTEAQDYVKGAAQ